MFNMCLQKDNAKELRYSVWGSGELTVNDALLVIHTRRIASSKALGAEESLKGQTKQSRAHLSLFGD